MFLWMGVIPSVKILSLCAPRLCPLIHFAHDLRWGPLVITVFIPKYVVGHWWERLVHNQSALRLKSRLLFQPAVMVTSAPYRLEYSPHDTAPSATR
jgi:hypothetical protein